ncbi:putative membrane protein [Candidatus Phytoplasma solani]
MNLRKIIIVSFLISLFFIFTILSNIIHLSKIRMPLVKVQFFAISVIPLIFMVMILNF